MNIYVINYKNDERKERMLQRYQSLDLHEIFRQMIFTKEVHTTDPRLQNLSNDSKMEPRIWSIMLQHLDSIRSFYTETNDEYCVVCEDDIHISKHLKEKMPGILNVFKSLNLDVLMLGYLLAFKIETHKDKNFPVVAEYQNLSYLRYRDDVWGCQMYMISRKYAKYLLSTFTIEYAQMKDAIPYSPDWIITKHGNRALVYEMLAVEEGVNVSDNLQQNEFHRRCHKCHMTDDFV